MIGYYLIQFGQLILSLSILIILHELGHFIAARAFKTRVEKFYLFFNPWFSLVKKKIGETTYGIGWLPLGGYVKISGMLDESMDTDQLKSPPKPYEFRSKPAWQRLIIMIGGVVVNFILAIVIYSFLFMGYGEKKLMIKDVKDGLWFVNSALIESGFQNGDKIISINDKNVGSFSETQEQLLYADEVLVERNGTRKIINLDENFIKTLIKNNSGLIMYPRVSPIIAAVSDSGGAFLAGMVKGDRILSVNGQEISFFDELSALLLKSKKESIPIEIERNGDIIKTNILVNESGKIGVQNHIPSLIELAKESKVKFTETKYSFFTSIPAGINKAIQKLKSYYNQFEIVLNPKTEAYKSVGGFATFSKLFGTQWNWQNFWEQTAFISVILAFMNLLPIPALDGGHILFLFFEMITGRKPNQKILEVVQVIGIILLFLVFIYANTDFIRNG